MANSHVMLQTLSNRRRSFLWWSIALVGFIGMVMAVYPSFQDMTEVSELLEQYPEFVRQVLGLADGLDFTSPAGFLNGEVMTGTLPIVMLIFTIGYAARETAGEERDGTLDLVLAHPITRERFLLEKYAAMLILSAGLLALTVGSIVLMAPMVGMSIGAGGVFGAALSATLVGVVHGTITFAVGAATGRRGPAIAAGAGVAVIGYVLWGLAPMVPAIAWTEHISLFFWAYTGTPIVNGAQVANLLLMAGVAALFVAGAVARFHARDVGV